MTLARAPSLAEIALWTSHWSNPHGDERADDDYSDLDPTFYPGLYRSRNFTVRDPEGNLWAFGTYRPRVGEG